MHMYVCMYVWQEQNSSMVVVLGSQPKGYEFDSYLCYIVVSLSSSLYPTLLQHT